MKKVAVYVRVSTAGQEDEETIDNQVSELKKRVKLDGHQLHEQFIYKDDGWTGTLLERPDLDRLRSDAKAKMFDLLYFYDRGRIARKFVYQEVVLDELQSLGIDCISLHDINGSTPEEMLMGSVMGIFHEYERVKITERMRLGKMHKVRENKKLLGYNPPYGYDYLPRIKGGENARDGRFVINKQEAEAVRKIFGWVAEGTSLREVIRKLQEEGIPPKKQKRDTWTKGPVVRLLQNTTYIGEHYYNKSEAIVTQNPKNPAQKYRRIKKTGRRVRPKEEWLPIKTPKIIDKDLFEKVQKQLELNVKFKHRNNKRNNYLLTGILECECGKPRTGDPGCNGNLYYRCTDRLTRFPMPRICYSGGVNAQIADTVVWGNLEQLLTNPKLIKQQADRWLNTKNVSPAKSELIDSEERIKKLDEEEKRYIKAYGTGYMSERLFKQQIEELTTKRSDLQIQAQKAKTDLAKLPTLSRDELVVGVKEMLGNLDFTDRKDIIRRIVTNIKATQEKIIIWGQLPVQAKLEVGFEPEYRHSRSTKRRKIDAF